jgi:hypothetical protein
VIDNKNLLFCRRKILKDGSLSRPEKLFLIFLLYRGTALRYKILSHINARIFPDHISDVEMRVLKAGLIEKGYPVGSHNSRGYFWQFSLADKDLGVAEYRSRALTELGKANKLERNYFEFYLTDGAPKQYNIFEINEMEARKKI